MTTPVLDLLQHQLAARHCPGALLLVERAGQVLARQALGRIHPDDPAPLHAGVRFRIASLTKPVVTVAALMLVDEGRLELDTPVGELLPALRGLRLADGRPAVPGHLHHRVDVRALRAGRGGHGRPRRPVSRPWLR